MCLKPMITSIRCEFVNILFEWTSARFFGFGQFAEKQKIFSISCALCAVYRHQISFISQNVSVFFWFCYLQYHCCREPIFNADFRFIVEIRMHIFRFFVFTFFSSPPLCASVLRYGYLVIFKFNSRLNGRTNSKIDKFRFDFK